MNKCIEQVNEFNQISFTIALEQASNKTITKRNLNMSINNAYSVIGNKINNKSIATYYFHRNYFYKYIPGSYISFTAALAN